jgi:NAD(P)-dependent dehydrogenase (short-subunit alcohol dehydrogenase family)
VPSTQELTGKVAVVTGASSGIGRAIAERLGAARAHVYLAGRTESAMQASKERIESNGGRATIATGDLRDPAKVQALVEQAARETGRLDIMVNNSGVSLPAPIIDADPEGWREMLELNILALLAGLPRRALRGDSAVNVFEIVVRPPKAALASIDSSEECARSTSCASWPAQVGLRVSSVTPAGCARSSRCAHLAKPFVPAMWVPAARSVSARPRERITVARWSAIQTGHQSSVPRRRGAYAR